MSTMDVLMDAADDGGSSPRPRRGLSQSMIAGRRKPGDRAAEPAAEEKPAPPARRRTAAKKDGDAPARRTRSTRSKDAESGEETGEAAKTEERKPRRSTRTPRAAAKTPQRESTRMAGEPSRPARDEDDDEVAPASATEVAMPESPVEQPDAPPELPPLPEVMPLPEGDSSALALEVGRLRALVEQQRTVLAELRAGMLTLGEQVDRSGYRPRLGVFVDVPNLMYGVEGGRPVHMGRLLDMLRDGRQLVRATAYSPVSDDPREPLEQQKFVSPFVPYDYRIVTKSLKRFADGSIKGNFDVEMAIDMISMADRVDVIAIVSGDADFARAVEAVQNKGVRVEVVAFAGSTSLEMRALADHFLELGTVSNRVT